MVVVVIIVVSQFVSTAGVVSSKHKLNLCKAHKHISTRTHTHALEFECANTWEDVTEREHLLTISSKSVRRHKFLSIHICIHTRVHMYICMRQFTANRHERVHFTCTVYHKPIAPQQEN